MLTLAWGAAALALCALSFSYGSRILIPEQLRVAPDGPIWYGIYGVLAVTLVTGGFLLGLWDETYFVLTKYGFLALSLGLFLAVAISPIQVLLFEFVTPLSAIMVLLSFLGWATFAEKMRRLV
jgi:hypothetical protein